MCAGVFAAVCHQVEMDPRSKPPLLLSSPLLTCVVLVDKKEREQKGIQSSYLDIASIFLHLSCENGRG